MKQILLDLLRGIRTGMFYMMWFICIVAGIWILCILHTLTPWLAVIAFTVSVILLLGSCVVLTFLGWYERMTGEEVSE